VRLKILLVGEESAGAQTLKFLAKSSHSLIGVMASPARNANGVMTVWDLAHKMGFRTWPAELVKDPQFAEVLYSEQIDLLLNVHSLYVIKAEIIEAPRFGSFNLHPGPLPRYAGLNAPCWAIYRDEKRHGVTLHKMLSGIDTGPIVFQSLFEIEEKDTGFSLSAKCIKAGVQLIKQMLETATIDSESVPQIAQDLTQREYFGKGTPDNGWLKWNAPARQVYNFVRAADYSPYSSPWITPRSKLGDHEIGFVKVSLTGKSCDRQSGRPGRIGQSDGESVLVACNDEWIAVNKLIINGKYISPGAILRPGEQLEWGESDQ
jgi:methionyl-tRNA formyltransferase